jgi:CubicO group peptidase (beta-lactamase class C family)
VRKINLTYFGLTIFFIFCSYKIKNEYFYLPYPNASEYISASFLLLFTLIIILWKTNRVKKIISGLISIAILMITINVVNYFKQWHPLNLSFPFTKSQSFEVDYEPYKWNKVTPTKFGYDNEIINNYLVEIEQWKRLRAMIVVKNDNIIIEKYFNGATKYSAFNVHSVTKSITSTLIGIAQKKGYIKSEDELIGKYFPSYQDIFSQKRPKSNISIAHLLTMQGGFIGPDGSQNVEKVLLNEKVVKENIGNEFRYFTGSHMLLSAILTNSTKLDTKTFAEKELFKPLQMNCGFWRNVDGYYCGGDETYYTARDLARFGTLYVNKGQVNGQQLVDSSWIKKTLTNYAKESKTFRILDCYEETGYGFSWWTLKYNDKTIFTARGKGGQYVLLIPDKNIIIVILQEWNLKKDFKSENAFLCKLLSIVDGSVEEGTNTQQLSVRAVRSTQRERDVELNPR